eukprot:g5552.t1
MDGGDCLQHATETKGGDDRRCAITKVSWVTHADDGEDDDMVGSNTSFSNVIHAKRKNKKGKGIPIFSVDIQFGLPFSTRFATGGADYTIRIWPIGGIFKEDDQDVVERLMTRNDPEAAEKKNRLASIMGGGGGNIQDDKKCLAILKSHSGSVNCVRFSPNGKVLASGADDNTVMLWTMDETSQSRAPTAAAFAGGGIEAWRRLLVCKGHTSDVTDLSWSPDCKLVASCSIDYTICVWDVAGELSRRNLVTSKPKAVLRHKSWVKGVAWDPIGLYLASASEDRSVIVWRTRDWQVERKITGLYSKTSSTFFRRLSWSPDGQCLCTTHGFDKGARSNVAYVLERENFTDDVNFVGHESTVVVSRFSSSLYGDKQNPYGACVIGSVDGLISLWVTSRAKPLLVVRRLFEQSITDFSFCEGPGFTTLLATATDGTVGAIRVHHADI